MDEVNHVKMVVSLCYFVVLSYFLCLIDDYEYSVNVLIGERFLKFYFAEFLNVLYVFRYQWVFHIWYQSEVETLSPIGLKTLHHVLF